MTKINIKFKVTHDPERFVVTQVEDYLFDSSLTPIKVRDFQSVFVTPEHMLRWVDKYLQGMEADAVAFEGEDENSSDAMHLLYHEFYIDGGSDPFYFLETETPDFYADEHFFDKKKVAGYVWGKTQMFYDHGIPIEEFDTVMEMILDWYDLSGEYFHWIEDIGYAQHPGDIDIDICRYVEE